MRPAARAQLAASHVPPARARIELLFALAKQARTASSGCVDDIVRIPFVGKTSGCNSAIARPKQKTKRNNYVWAL